MYKVADVKNPVQIFVEKQVKTHFDLLSFCVFQLFQTENVRKFVVGAVLRDIRLDPDCYASFIDLQDKLHQNIGRKRTLASIGTHDMDTIKGMGLQIRKQILIWFLALLPIYFFIAF